MTQRRFYNLKIKAQSAAQKYREERLRKQGFKE